MTDREELERQVARAVYSEVFGDPNVPYVDAEEGALGAAKTSRRAARAALDSLGLTEEVAWDAEGREIDAELSLYDDGLRLDNRVTPATDEELRAAGLVKKRRWITEWEVVDD